jgi:hypothetical protein
LELGLMRDEWPRQETTEPARRPLP